MFNQLRQAIVQLQLRPGNLLSEADVAKQIGTSRQPVREAFIKLADIGLVKIKPQRGTFVTLISTTDVEKARFIREAIEVAIVRKVAMNVTDQDITDLEKLIEQQKKINVSKDYPKFLQLGEAFHVRISRIADFSGAWRVLENSKSQIDRVRYLNLPTKAGADMTISQHQGIVDALATHSPDVAEKAMATHLSTNINSLASIAASHPDLFGD
ncbi:Transcriptional regulator, GntR family [hydrothermal vent metagenome]|uniref:Transcriptional regulator, GntR family n=1 Tax=hydrothermal vent metagenome TaxID=652676 RepID=A0A3B0UNJ2_9ZZZZ